MSPFSLTCIAFVFLCMALMFIFILVIIIWATIDFYRDKEEECPKDISTTAKIAWLSKRSQQGKY